MSAEISFSKGHGTGNDFVLFADPEGQIELSQAQIIRLCDRRFGIGGDGLIRAVLSKNHPEARTVLAENPEAEWFMDYRNADGNSAEMCGNGIRVYAAYLDAQNYLNLAVGEKLTIATRAGVRHITRTEIGYEVGLGSYQLAGKAMVSARRLAVDRPGLAINIGNPHTVVALASEAELEALNLTAPPVITPNPPEGANVEFVVPADPLIRDGVGHIRMRVHERGSGETYSCGTGAAAAAIATRIWAGDGAPDNWLVSVPGGELGVRITGAENSLRVFLAGPAEIVYRGTITVLDA